MKTTPIISRYTSYRGKVQTDETFSLTLNLQGFDGLSRSELKAISASLNEYLSTLDTKQVKE